MFSTSLAVLLASTAAVDKPDISSLREIIDASLAERQAYVPEYAQQLRDSQPPAAKVDCNPLNIVIYMFSAF